MFPVVKIISEIEINHNGDINLAKDLILLAKNCGCDAVKIPKRGSNIKYCRRFICHSSKSQYL